jgi:hypothetical protein
MSSSVSSFEHTAATLRLSKEATARAWEMLRDLRIGPEDPEAVRILLHVSMLEDAARIKGAARGILDEAKGTITNAAKETAGNLADAAAKVERASAEKLAAQTGELVSKVSAEIAASADKALTRKVATHQRNTFTAWVATALVAAGLTGAVGYEMGKANEAANAGQISSVLQREDGAEWIRLMQANDAQASIANYCRNGSPNVHHVDGGTFCELPLWLSHDGVVSPVPGRPVDGGAVLAEVSGWLASWGPWWLLGAGTMAFLAVRLLVAWTVEIDALRRILALPSRATLQAGE